MNIFADDQTNTNQKEIVRKGMAAAGGPIIGGAAHGAEKRKAEEQRALKDASFTAQLTALEIALQDPAYRALYDRVSTKLDQTQSDLDQAMLENAEDIERLEDNAAHSNDGAMIFQKADGSFVYADGKPVPGSDMPDVSSISDNVSQWDEYRRAKEREAELARIQGEILDPIRRKMNDPEYVPEKNELEGMDEDLDRAKREIENPTCIAPATKVASAEQVAGLGFSMPVPAS